MRVQLTKRLVMGAQPKSSPYEMRDILIKGLLLRVQPSGHKAWVVEWARGRRKTLGALSELSLEEARAEASQAMAEALRHGAPGLAKPKRQEITLREFLDLHYAPWARSQLKWGAGVEDRLRTAFAGLQGRRLQELDPWVIDRWWGQRLAEVSPKTKKPLTKATASRELAALRSALNKAVEWGFLTESPLKGLKQRPVEASKVVRYLSPEEEGRLRGALAARDHKLIAARRSGNAWSAARGRPLRPELPEEGYGDHLSPIVLLALNTGLRRGEILTLSWGDIDLGRNLVRVRAASAKNGRARYVPLNAEARSALTKWAEQAPQGEKVFPVSDIKTSWGSILRAADIQQFRFHDLRHHFASRLVMKAVDLNSVRELLGHADLKMTLRYAHLAPAHLAEAVSRLG